MLHCIPVFKLLLLGQSTFLYLYLFFLNGQGLIALLAVVDALSNVNELAGLDKQVSLCLIIYPLQILLTECSSARILILSMIMVLFLYRL